MKRCIISFAQNGREHYTIGLPRMVRSAIAHGHNGKDCCFGVVSPDSDYQEIDGIKINRWIKDMPEHKDVPYGFKPYMFDAVRKAGFQQVLWCDSTIIHHASLEPIWDACFRRGVWAGDNPGCPQSKWTDPVALDKMGCPRDAGFNQIMCCAVAFDFGHIVGASVFADWFELCKDGVTFKGEPGSKVHRHDQSALSWLLHKHRVDISPYGMLAYHGDRPQFPENILANTGIYEVPNGNPV